MKGMIFVTPNAGKSLLNPDNQNQPLKQEGEWVPDNIFWRRRVLHEDVVQSSGPMETKEVKAKENKETSR
jgi:hypothetical protein